MRYSSLAILVAASLASSLALAQTTTSNIITFEGQVLDESCQATINGSADAVVRLDPVKESDFGQDKTAGLTPFTMEIKDCKHTDNKNIQVRFIASNPVNGNLDNIEKSTNAAEHVLVQLTDDKGGKNPIMLKDGTAVVQFNNKFSARGDGTHEFGVQYYKDGDIKPGKVKAEVKYQLSYL